MWGDTAPLDEDVSAVSYRLSEAGRGAQGASAVGRGVPTESVAATEALYRCGVTALAPAGQLDLEIALLGWDLGRGHQR